MKNLIKIILLAVLITSTQAKADADIDFAIGALMGYHHQCQRADYIGMKKIIKLAALYGHKLEDLPFNKDYNDGLKMVSKMHCSQVKEILQGPGEFYIFK